MQVFAALSAGKLKELAWVHSSDCCLGTSIPPWPGLQPDTAVAAAGEVPVVPRHCWGHPLPPLRQPGELPCSSEAAARSLPLLTHSEVCSCPRQGSREAIRPVGEGVTEEVTQWTEPVALCPKPIKELRVAVSTSTALTRWGPTL